MGVRTFLANRFTAARQYLLKWKRRSRDCTPSRPRRDLELEAIGEILQGKRLIHCHGYRQDEILVFLRTMESFGVKVATLRARARRLQNRRRNRGARRRRLSSPIGGPTSSRSMTPSLTTAASCATAACSSSSTPIPPTSPRRLNTEAAKAVKYGGTPEVEALKFVTINPAKQLRIDQRVGSLEPGKDADFVIWSRSPLDSRTVVPADVD